MKKAHLRCCPCSRRCGVPPVGLFLGSRDRYSDQFSNYPGTYWYAQDYIERDNGSGGALALGSANDVIVKDQYQEYVEKYGKDNADYLMEVMGAWQAHYQRAAYIDMGIGNGDQVEQRARAEAARRGWTFEKLKGDYELVRRLLDGKWDEDYQVIRPGEKVIMTYDEKVIGCVLNG